ncbi:MULTISPECIES: class I adenylate-forming enzyme family protein [unclassified Sinorhizobium]|uniref:class I adenylate-forming enzyme family protein n=1 Tax=unclassified Sinorhizobium TaxID=2613772 RepID=UPI003523A6EC
MTILERLFHAAETRPHQIAFIADERNWSFRRFAGHVECMAQALSAHGVRPGDRVALHMDNVAEIAIAYFACFRLGAIAAPLNNRLKTPELSALLERLQPALYIGQDHLYPLIASIDPQILPVETRFIVGRTTMNGGARPFDALFDHGKVTLEASLPPETAPVLLLTTSGTTGHPKFVAHNMATMTAFAEGFLRFGLVPGDIVVSSSAMVHGIGLFSFISSFYHGGRAVLLERFDPDAMLDAIAAHGATWVMGLPFMFSAMLERQRTQPRDISSLRFCLAGGDVCPAALQQEFPFVFDRPLHSNWGMSETAGVLAFGKRPGPVYPIVPGVEIRLVDDKANPVPRGMPGELLVRGANIALGYWVGPGQVEPCGADGWLATGDIMRQDERNELWFVSRKKDLIVRGGSNISPIEVEEVLRTHPSVRDVAVLGTPDLELGQRVAALIALADGSQDGVLVDILATARARLADYKLPERLQVVEEIPKNAFGKIDRKSLPGLLTS